MNTTKAKCDEWTNHLEGEATAIDLVDKSEMFQNPPS
jgi:hypothetical protein